MGIVKKIVGGFKVAAGVVTGNPALIASGGSDIATDFASKNEKESVTQPGSLVEAPKSPSPSIHFRSIGQGSHSLEERRNQNRERMGRVYKYPGTG